MPFLRSTILSSFAAAAAFAVLSPGSLQGQDTPALQFSDTARKELTERAQRGMSVEDLGAFIGEHGRISAPRGMERGRLTVMVVDPSGRVLGTHDHRFTDQPEEEEIQMIPARDLGAFLGRFLPGGVMIQPDAGGDDLFVPTSRLMEPRTMISSPAEGARVAAEAGVRAIRASGNPRGHAILFLLTPDEDRFSSPIPPRLITFVGARDEESPPR